MVAKLCMIVLKHFFPKNMVNGHYIQDCYGMNHWIVHIYRAVMIKNISIESHVYIFHGKIKRHSNTQDLSVMEQC